MPDSPINALPTIKAEELEPQARQRLASVLHVDLSDADELLVTLKRSIKSPGDARRVAARERLLQFLHRIDEQAPAVSEAEMETAINEAMQFVRPRG